MEDYNIGSCFELFTWPSFVSFTSGLLGWGQIKDAAGLKIDTEVIFM